MRESIWKQWKSITVQIKNININNLSKNFKMVHDEVDDDALTRER